MQRERTSVMSAEIIGSTVLPYAVVYADAPRLFFVRIICGYERYTINTIHKMKKRYAKILVTPLDVCPCEGVCGGSAKVAVKTTGQPVEEIRFDDKDGSGNFIYNNTWEEAN